MIGPQHESHLAGALSDLLGAPVQGAVAFLRCLPSTQIDSLIDSASFTIPGWNVNAVVDRSGHRRITADQAVEQREDKAEATLFLIDPLRAGAGLDGIYSAAREISESDLFGRAQERARKELRGHGTFLTNAIRRAERMGRRRRLPPWCKFDFFVTAATDGHGKALARIGLWPVDCDGPPDNAYLDLAAAMAARLLYAEDARSTGERVRALQLENTSNVIREFEHFLRGLADQSPDQIVVAAAEHPEYCLGRLKPRFSGDALQSIRLASWRDARAAILKWSGLASPEADAIKARLVLDRNAAAKDRAKLTVRWSTSPDVLAAGSVEYRVAMLAGEDLLAEVLTVHRDKPFQQATFAIDDFEELEGTEKFEAVVEISAVAQENVAPVRTEDFVVEFGESPGKAAAASGQIVRTLVEGALSLPSRAAFDEAIADGGSTQRTSEDRKGYITWKAEAGGRAIRVLRPTLIRQLEEDWVARGGGIGRWVQRIRIDGSPVGLPQFVPIDQLELEGAQWDRVRDASRRLSSDMGPCGLLARVHVGRWPAADAYVNAWAAALDNGHPELSLHGTIEIQTMSGRTLGLIVTPLHPLRFAWHELYDRVAYNARYDQDLSAPAVLNTMGVLDSSHFPFALPGTAHARAFVFADVLGFHTVAMTVDGEPEPKAAVALMSTCLGGVGSAIAPSIGVESASVLAREIKHFLSCHQGSAEIPPELLNIQAWRPGDGMTVARALGQVLNSAVSSEGDDDAPSPLCFTLDVYHPASSNASGQFLTTVGRRRRTGGGVLEASDRWMTETAPRAGGVLMPRLRWAKRPEPEGTDTASWDYVRASHLGVIFDIFDARLEVRPIASLGAQRPLQAYGLARTLERRVKLDEEPEWTAYAAPDLTGESAPENRTASDRLRRVDKAISRATAKSLGGGTAEWPVLVTRLPLSGRNRIDRLHERCEWVITIDRNAGVEYFDAPNRFSDVYARFVIDAVPERVDLGTLQLVTSTTNLDAVRDLVDQALSDMGLSSSERNSRFLIEQLKALSGRLAIRLANAASQTGELIALALVQANCVENGSVADSPWLDLAQGFLVPVDEIGEFAPIVSAKGDVDESGRRADFIHVRAPARGPLEFRFVEVKHRLHLRTARQTELMAQMLQQTGDLRRRWMNWFFGAKLTPIERSIRRWQLARMLSFYADRAHRHRLGDKEYTRLRSEIDLLLLKDEYQPAEVDAPDIGYVFCPEHRTGNVEPLYPVGGEQSRFWLFGPTFLPDERYLPHTHVRSIVADQKGEEFEEHRATDDDETRSDPAAAEVAPIGKTSDSLDVLLGTASSGQALVEWQLSIRANPHLMIVGLPGMGKTTALINICRQLKDGGIAPIVFSYHEDIDAKLADYLGPLNTVDVDSLNFNPLRIDSASATAHVDVSGTLRDVFSSIFPDLGEIQLEELRQAIKQSYDDLGWAAHTEAPRHLTPPRFRAFFDILKTKHKPNHNLLARLQELADYGFFDGTGERASLLDDGRPTVVRLHSTSNAMLQAAFSSFVLYSLYKDMFRRGVQDRFTHAVIFDEAHRAAKLKLIPRMAKESRKYGISLALASQGAKDFDGSLYEAVGSYLILRVAEADARALARNIGTSSDQQRTSDRLKSLQPYHALFVSPNLHRPMSVSLQQL